MRDVVKGHYGETSLNLLFAIAGQSGLPWDEWRDYEKIISRMPLESFSEDETRSYLARKGITDIQVAAELFRKTEGLPVMVMLSVAGRSGKARMDVDPRDTVIEHVLKGIEPQYRQVALDAALPRRLNRDVLAELIGTESAGGVFGWLKRMRFVQQRTEGWFYHPVVRDAMLSCKRRESPEAWAELHRRLGEYYTRRREQLGLAGKQETHDSFWRELSLETLYHRVCENPHRYLTYALDGFAVALKFQRSFGQEWAETLLQAEEDTQVPQERRWGERLAVALKAYAVGQFTEASGIFTALLKYEGLGNGARALALSWRGYLHYLVGHEEEALKDLTAAVELAPSESEYLHERGRILFSLLKHDEALADLEHAISLKPDAASYYATRSLFWLRLNKHAEARADVDQLLVLEPENVGWKMSQFLVLLGTGDFTKAFEVSLRLSSNAGQYVKYMREHLAKVPLEQARRETRLVMSHLGMPSEFTQWFAELADAIVQGNDADIASRLQANTLVTQALNHGQSEAYDQALASVSQAIELCPQDPSFLIIRADIFVRLKRIEAAKKDFDQAVVLAPGVAEFLKWRGEFHFSNGHYEQSLADYSRAIELSPESRMFVRRSLLHRLRGSFSEALSDLERAIALSPSDSMLVFGKIPLHNALRDAAGIVATYKWLAEHAREFVQQLKRALAHSDQNQQIVNVENWLWAVGANPKGELGTLERIVFLVVSEEELGVKAVQSDAASIAALVHRQKGEFAEALARLDYAIALESNHAMHWLERAETYRSIKRYAEALRDLDCALSLQPNSAIGRILRGALYLHKGRPEESLADISHVLEQTPDSAQALFLRVLLYRISGRYEEALADLDKIVVHDADSIEEMQNIRGGLFVSLGRYAEALETYRQVLTLNPANWRASYSVVVTRAHIEGWRAVQQELASIGSDLRSKIDSADRASALVRLGGLEAVSGNLEQAFGLLNEALLLDPLLIYWAKEDIAWSTVRVEPRFQLLLEEKTTLIRS